MKITKIAYRWGLRDGPVVCIEADAGTVEIKLRNGRTLTIDVKQIDEIVVHNRYDEPDEVVGAHDVTEREVAGWDAEVPEGESRHHRRTVVHHVDGDSYNNDLANVEFMDASDNDRSEDR